jgi:hypothetical protein
LDEEELHATLDGQIFSHLVGEVLKVGLDEALMFAVVLSFHRPVGNPKRKV